MIFLCQEHDAKCASNWNAERCRASARREVVNDRLTTRMRVCPGKHCRLARSQSQA